MTKTDRTKGQTIYTTLQRKLMIEEHYTERVYNEQKTKIYPSVCEDWRRLNLSKNPRYTLFTKKSSLRSHIIYYYYHCKGDAKFRTLSRTSDTTETRNPIVIKVIVLACFTHIAIFKFDQISSDILTIFFFLRGRYPLRSRNEREFDTMTFITIGFRVSVVSDVRERVRNLASPLRFVLRSS
jgi:hypothetical protein